MKNPTFFGTKIHVPYILGEEVIVTITEPVDKIVMAPGPDGENIVLGTDLKASATVELGANVYRGFTIIENMFERDNFRVGNIYIGTPTEPDGRGGWKPKYPRYRYMDKMGIAVRIAYMAAKGVTPNLVRYAQEDRFGQTCSTCDCMQRPGRGNPDMICAIKTEGIDMSELQKEKHDIIELGGRYFQSNTIWIRDFNDMPKPWFRDIEALDSFFTSISIGLAADLGYKKFEDVYPAFNAKGMMAIDCLTDDELVDREAVTQVLEVHDRLLDLNGLVLRMAFDIGLTRDDRERFPKTIQMFEDHHVAEDKGYTMQFVSNDMLEAYGVNSTCAYGANDHHKNGFQTEQVLVAMDIRNKLMEIAYPVIITSHIGKINSFSGFEVIDVRQELLAPSPEVDALPGREFVTAYLAELRTKFPAIKGSLAEILRNDKILVVGQDPSFKERDGVGFDVISIQTVKRNQSDPWPTVLEIDNSKDIHARHVFAWMLSKLSKRHHLGVHNA